MGKVRDGEAGWRMSEKLRSWGGREGKKQRGDIPSLQVSYRFPLVIIIYNKRHYMAFVLDFSLHLEPVSISGANYTLHFPCGLPRSI